MCGIFGLWNLDLKPVPEEEVQLSTNIVKHRGPDDVGFYFTNTSTGQWSEAFVGQETRANLAFGFRRLAILDLSSSGHQPMHNREESLWIVFNGEIYNYIELRQELVSKGYQFYTATDTEVILNAYSEWGEGCLDRLNGMWAFAIWDTRHQSLFCARDRFGIKPFYYFWNGKSFAFASEIKSLFVLPHLSREPNPNAVYDYLRNNSLDHTDTTFFNQVHQLLPAHYLTLNLTGFSVQRYWSVPVNQDDAPLDVKSYSQTFAALFEDAVRLHLRSDVAIGSCLSGGLDSSAIVCVANKLLFSDKVLDYALVGHKQKTFSACFDDPVFDERQYIEKVIQITNAEPNYTFPNPKQLLEDLPCLIWHQEEPFGSLSIYAQWCVMRAVSERGIKVTLDGQGSDEMLAGYHHFFDSYWANLAVRKKFFDLTREWQAYQKNSGMHMIRLIARTIRALFQEYIPRNIKQSSPISLPYPHLPGINRDFTKMIQKHEDGLEPAQADPFYNNLYRSVTHESLPKLLHYEDRNSMAFSIESRVPFLDFRLVEFAFRLPADQKIHQGLSKVVLREAMRGVLPEEIRLRKDKMGFVTPEKKWMANELNSWVWEIINSRSFYERGYFNVPEIKTLFKNYALGQIDLTGTAWRWINLELWLRQMIEGTPQVFR